MSEKKQLIMILGISLAVYFAMKYLLPYVIPFLIAWALVRGLNPLLKKIRNKLPWKKEVLMSILVLLVFVAAGVLVYFLYRTVMEELCRVASNFDRYYDQMGLFLDDCCSSMEQKIGVKAERIRSVIDRGLENVQVQIDGKLIPGILNHSLQYIIKIIEIVGFVFIIYVAMLLLMKDYDQIREDLEKYETYQSVKRITDRIFHTGGAYLRSQFILIGIVTVLCVIGLYLLGNDYALLLGIVIGLLDALPFLGTGTVLLPWAAVLLIQKKIRLAAGYAVLFFVTNTARELLEPKLVGERIGIYPFAVALSVYAGVCLFGPLGVFTGPVGLILIVEICREFLQRRDTERLK